MVMSNKLMIFLTCCFSIFFISPVYSQLQSCPANINFSAGSISDWSAQTGLRGTSNSQPYPAPNGGVSNIPEYHIPATGIQVITTSTNDLYGGFPTIPTINGYAYNYSVKIGSTNNSYDYNVATGGQNGNPGGFTRSITYLINVPAGPVTVPYTMTYAYAMVLENGTHNSNEQPLFKATLTANNNVISCASPEYYLPTFNNAQGGGGTGATLDTATAIANGFSNSPVLFFSHAGAGGFLQDVWTKGWTEVTFDLSPYRGQLVTLTFESDNCTPGAHFAYAYVALRNTCAGLLISGDTIACTNNSLTYSVPSLGGATYSWTIPPGWTINSGNNSNIINVTAGNSGGFITANEINSCANLKDTIAVSTTAPTIAGTVTSNNTVCSGTNSTLLNLNGQSGNILNWISSTDGTNWNSIPGTTGSLNYSALNLDSTTLYSVVVQNGPACKMDTSTAATVVVDPKSVGGILDPSSTVACLGQSANTLFTLSGNTGSVINWQLSNDSTNWSNFSPTYTNTTYAVNNIATTTEYRVIVQSGVCPADTSSMATISLLNVPFPSATISPVLSDICYGKSIQLNANINIGTSYSWSNSNTLTNQGNGNLTSVPAAISATAMPSQTTQYVLSINNAGCPNPLLDTFTVNVSPPIIVFAGNDTSIVANQPLQLNATVNDSAANIWTWIPSTGLNSTNIPNPIAILNQTVGDYITYTVRASDLAGCYGEANINVTIFKTGPQIFVPSAFTPNGDGRNDIIRPICVGIRQLNYFRIYNRWGQLVYSTSEIGKGWDGMINGMPQSTANYVYMVQGIDYLGHVIIGKGNVVLIR